MPRPYRELLAEVGANTQEPPHISQIQSLHTLMALQRQVTALAEDSATRKHICISHDLVSECAAVPITLMRAWQPVLLCVHAHLNASFFL